MQEKPAGAPPFKAHRSAYRELMENLYVATKTFQEEGDGGIEGAKLACRAMVRFVAVRHENPELAAPFLAIYKAFEDLEREIEPELFSKNKALKDRSRSSQRKHLQMLASVAMDVMMALGDVQDLAAGQVAAHVAKWPGIRPGTVSRTTIRNWRDNYLAMDSVQRAQFEKLRTHILAQPDPRADLKQLLERPPGIAKT